MSQKPGNRILLVGGEKRLPCILERDSGNSVRAEAAGAVHEALDRLAEKGWDAVVCWAEREDELAAVIRI